MSAPDLFSDAGERAAAEQAPLAVRMRPRTLDEIVGQQHLLGPGTPLRRIVETDQPASIILWGPPGTGKTTIAAVVAQSTKRRFVELSAVMAGVKDVRAAIDEAKTALGMRGRRTVLFIDEVHRFSKTQQDALLPSVENRWVSLIAATTENPFFSVVSPLLSRSLLLTLEPLSDDDIRTVIERALVDERGLGGRVTLGDGSLDHLLRLAGGDARRALTYLESAASAAETAGGVLTLEILEKSVDKAAVRYDRTGDQHYDVASAFIKSMRGSDVDAALHYLARMIVAGEDPRFIARRIVIFCSEDIGMADPTALQTAIAAAQAVSFIGLPEARINLAHAVVHACLAPKSNRVIGAIDAAIADVRAGLAGPVPSGMRDAHYPGAAKLDHGATYRYPHNFPGAVVTQQYSPDAVYGRSYYDPTNFGAERIYAERWHRIRPLIHGEPMPPPAATANTATPNTEPDAARASVSAGRAPQRIRLADHRRAPGRLLRRSTPAQPFLLSTGVDVNELDRRHP